MILIAIGSNLNSDLFGTPRKNCEAALSVMKNYFEILNISNFYKTEPIPKSSQPWFVNSVVNCVLIVVNCFTCLLVVC